MQQTFEYYTVDPGTWKDNEMLTNVKTTTITRDSETATLGSATIDVTETLGEEYVRIYLITIQNGIKEKFPLGTFIVQTPSSTYNGSIRNVTMDAYTPLLELKEKMPPLGYSLLKGENVMNRVYQLCNENARAPVVMPTCDTKLYNDFVANASDTWLTFNADLMANAKYKFDLDEMGRILFSPEQDTASLQPVWHFNDGNSSILQPEITLDHDIYGIPNVVEVICSSGRDIYYAKVVNDDENSPTSIQQRGREIIHRVTNPGFSGDPSNAMVQEYAERLLKELSTIKRTVSFTHGYCPVRVGDCVLLDYERAGITDIKARIISQTIKCESGVQITAKAVFTSKVWR